MKVSAPHPVQSRSWGELPDGRKVHRWTLRNAQDMRVEISDLGATLLSWHAPDRQGRLDNVLLGHAHAVSYAAGRFFMGGVIGRWANRIRRGTFELDGVSYRVDRNENGHHLHGGNTGFHLSLWQVERSGDDLLLRLHSPDGDGGYPGNLDVQLRYALQDDGSLCLDYQARCDQATPINLTAHPYFNLGGERGELRDHLLHIDAEEYLAVDESLLPIRRDGVAGSAFDFRHPAPLGSRLDWPDPQLKLAGGFDHCFCLRDSRGQVRDVAEARYPATGRRLAVRTDRAGLHLYTGQHLVASDHGAGEQHRAFGGFCLEAEAFPDQINSPTAEQAVLRAGQVYRQHTSYKLDIG